MTVKGQVTVPKDLRDAFGWRPGVEVGFLKESNGVKIVRAGRRGRGAQVLERLKGARWKRGLSTDRLLRLTRGES